MRYQPRVFETLKSAARTAAAEGHPKEAQAIFTRVASVIERQLGGDSLEYASCLYELAEACAEQRLWHMAEVNYRNALAVYRRQLPEPDARIAMLLRGLAESVRSRGDQMEARRLELQAGRILSRCLEARAK